MVQTTAYLHIVPAVPIAEQSVPDAHIHNRDLLDYSIEPTDLPVFGEGLGLAHSKVEPDALCSLLHYPHWTADY